MKLFILGSASWFNETINFLMLWLCDMLYEMIGLLYQVFVAISQVNLFSKQNFEQITKNMYVIMGIAMLFIFAYNIVLMIINPDDKKSTGSTTKIVKETIISLSLVILLPTIFNWMYIFQNNVINSGIISSLLLNNVGSNSVERTCDYSKYGFDKYATYAGTGIVTGEGNHDFEDKRQDIETKCNEFKKKTAQYKSLEGAYLVAPTILSAFYRPTYFTLDECVDFLENGTNDGTFDNGYYKQICINYYYDIEYSKLTGSTSVFTKDKYLNYVTSDSEKGWMELHALLAIVAGVIAAIMYFSYCIEIGVRVAKLAVLQMISPIVVMIRIIPKQKEAFFDKWFKQLKDTYLDVFIRLLIINFALFAVSLVPDVIKTLFSSIGSIDNNTFIKAVATVFVILGILQFSKECPSLLKEFFGGNGKFSVKGGFKKLSNSAHTVGGVAGSVAALGYMGGRSIKNIATAGKGNKLKQVGKELLNSTRTAGVIKAGYTAGKKSGVSDFISNVGDSEHNVRYKRSTFGSIQDNLALAKSKRLGDVSNKYSAIEKILDSKAPIQSLTTTFEEQRKSGAKQTTGTVTLNGESFNLGDISQKQDYLNKLDKQFKTERNRLRMIELQKGLRENDKEIQDNYELYLDSLKENKSELNAMLKEYAPNSTGINLDMLDAKNIINQTASGDLFNNAIRTPGSNAGKESNSINRRVQEKKSKSNGN